MHESAPDGGLRKVKRANYLQILNDTARDTKISYRALGILTELLSHEEGWVVRAADLGRRRKEGREAIATALRELAAAGYYRVEKRRKPSGKFSMGTAVADYPVPEWIEDFKRHPHGGVPLRVTEDGQITRMDGSAPETVPDDVPSDSPEPGFWGPVTGTGFSESGDSDSGLTDSGNPPPFRTPSQNTITEGSAALRAATAPDPVETSSSSVQDRNASAPDAAHAAGDHGDAPRAVGARQTRNPADILDGMMLNPDEAQRFRGWLVDATGATNPDGLVVSLNGSGLLSERLMQWRASESGTAALAAPDAPATPRAGRLEWCGRCDQHTRMMSGFEGDGTEYLRRCPTCHVLAGVEQPGAGAHQVIAMQAATAARATGAGRAAFQAARAQLPAGTPRRDTTIGTTIDPTTARETAESEH
jgi:hypothetical protein